MPLIVKDRFLEKNGWLIGDLSHAIDLISTIKNDLDVNGKTHVEYVLEKLEVAESIIANINSLCRNNSALVEKGDKDE